MKLRAPALAIFIAAITFCTNTLTFADEWKPRHDLVSHTGVMNLTGDSSAERGFFRRSSNTSDQPDGCRDSSLAQRSLARFCGTPVRSTNGPDLLWTQRIFSQVQLLIWDRSFYDPEKGEYTVDRFLAETESRIGPIDAVLIWHVYPNLGVDDRNQFDMLRDMPAGTLA